jgi:hypothetical protein
MCQNTFSTDSNQASENCDQLEELCKVAAGLAVGQCNVSPVAVTRARTAARAASCARTFRMMNSRQPLYANGFRFRRAWRLFFFVAAVFTRSR